LEKEMAAEKSPLYSMSLSELKIEKGSERLLIATSNESVTVACQSPVITHLIFCAMFARKPPVV